METRPYKYTAKEVEDLAKQYFQDCKENPIIRYDVVKTGEHAGKVLEIPITRPYTVEGLCLWLKVTRKTFYEWMNEQKNIELLNISTHVNDIIKNQQISGASAGIYNPMIISRINGLTEKIEQTTATIDATNKTDEEIRAAIHAIEQARKK